MFPVSAADAVSPAIRRTKQFLFQPFRLGTYLKLCLVAVITEGLAGNSNYSGSHSQTSHSSGTIYPPVWQHAGWIAVIVAALALAVVVGCFIFYLITRLRFAYFHCLIPNTREIRPGWWLYRAQAGRFFWLNIMVGLCFLALVAVLALPFIARILAVIRSVHAGGRPDIAAIVALVLPLIPVILLVVLLGLAVDVVLRDLMLPHYALENATAGEAWGAVWARIRVEKGQFFGYALLRIVLPMVAMIALFLLLLIPAIFFFASTAIVEVGINATFSGATGAVSVIGILLGVGFGVLAAGIAFVVGIGVGGPLSTAIREYALLFYGGRYQRLGDILWPPLAGATAPGMG
ncbi:MAG TPA: hypothetical protein VIY53_13785 [Acidobacteriaceae bacterium]